MKNLENTIFNRKKNSHSLILITLSLLVSGCLAIGGMYFHGGKLVSDGYKIPKTIITYKTEGTAPKDAQYLLIETEEGLAMFERGLGGGGALFQNYWQDEKGDHFWAFIVGGVIYEFIIPIDRTKEGYRYVHPNGSITANKINGIVHIESKDPNFKPVTKLIPITK
jgi:hypothetical protein